jgi:hypothetical protein
MANAPTAFDRSCQQLPEPGQLRDELVVFGHRLGPSFDFFYRLARSDFDGLLAAPFQAIRLAQIVPA